MTMPFIFLLILTNPPIERIGELCPAGYWRSAAYCVPSPARVERYQALPNRLDGDCPMGFYRSGRYCVRTR
jgi:hypothetical protein